MLFEVLDILFFLERIANALTAVVGVPLFIVYGLVVLRSQHHKNQLQIQQLEQHTKENNNR